MSDTTERSEPLRAWYKNKTRGPIRLLLAASFATVVAGVLLWVMADLPFLARMQTFNGAIIIPAFGGIWIASFMFIWLIPMRELSFRGQESLDRTEARVTSVVEEAIPAIKVWKRIGEKVDGQLLPRIEKTLDNIDKVVAEAQSRVAPAGESVRRLENEVTGKIGLLSADVKEASQAIKKFFGPQGAPPDPVAADAYLREKAAAGNGRQHQGVS